MNKKLYVLLAAISVVLPLSAGAGLVQLGQTTPQSAISSPYTTQCVANFPHAFYEGQSFRAYETQTPSSLGSSREMLDTTNAKIYNPFNVLGNTLTSNTLGGLLPAFTYRSNGRPGTNHFNFNGIGTLMVYKQNDFTYTTKPSPNPSRASIAAQIVHNLYRKQIKSRGSTTNFYTMTYVDINSNGGHFDNVNPSDRYPTVNDYECQNFYVAKCGDGVRDNPNKPGTSATDGKNGILVNGSILPWTSVAPAEDCDGSDGTPAGYTCNSSCKLEQVIINPSCILTPPSQTITCGQNAILNFNSTNTTSITNLVHISGGLIVPNSGGRFSVSPTQTTTYSFTANGMAGSTPAICTAVVNVQTLPNPNCSLTPAQQTITAGQNAILNFNSTFTNSITNLINITGGLITPNHAGRFSVSPTQTTTYSFTVNGGVCNVPKTCSATVNVFAPNLWIDKKLITNTLYQSGDLVGFRIDFGNNGTGTAHNVVLTDYLPVSLSYVSSHLYGISGAYNFGTGMFGLNPEIIYSGFDLAPGQAGYMIITGKLLSLELCTSTLNTSFIESTETAELYDADWFSCYTPTTTNLTIDKKINTHLFYPNEYIYFSIEVTNHGPDVASSVRIGDIRPNISCILPGGWSYGGVPVTMTNTNPPYEWTLNAPLNVGQTVYLYLTGQVANSRSCAGSYLNTGTLTYVYNNQVFTGYDVEHFVVPTFTPGQCRELDIQGGSNVVVVEDDDGNYDGEASFTCYAENGVAQNISINCGDGEIYSDTNVSHLHATCHFDGDTDDLPEDRDVVCSVDGDTNEDCTQEMTIDQGGFGRCGDGQVDEWEDCDDGVDNGTPNSNCSIGCDLGLPMATCFSLGNTNISIQEDEILPFRWKVDFMGSKVVDRCEDKNGDPINDGKILRDSMQCEFRIFNGEKPESGKGSNLGDYNAPTVKTITKDCDIDERVNGNGNLSPLFKYFDAQSGNNYTLKKYDGRYALDFSTVDLDGIYGEYNIALYKVKYDYCQNGEAVKGIPLDRVCETDFTVTKPYLAQKSSFGVIPKITSVKLDDYLDIFGKPITTWTDLDKITVLDADEYQGGTNVNALMTSFINKYSKLGVRVDKNKIDAFKGNTDILSVKIIPQQKIYIIVGKTGTTLTLNPGDFGTTPFTIVTRHINLVVQGDLTTNGMFLVDGGTITFKEPTTNRCGHTQTVQGIFITNKGFAATTENLSNNDTDKPRCAFGGLHVKGVLIGKDVQKLVDSRRSQLNHWFSAGRSTDAAVLTERRNEIFNGAAVLIEYSPGLWNNLPPGANEFTKALDVYKK